MKLFTSTYTAELVAYDYMGEYEKGIEVVDDIVAGIDKYKDKSAIIVATCDTQLYFSRVHGRRTMSATRSETDFVISGPELV